MEACSQDTNDGFRAGVVTHELVHGLGAVQTAAPNYCQDGHVCSGSHVDVDWVTSPRYDGLNFRIYDETGTLQDDTPDTSLEASAPIGQTLSWVFRAYDAGGFLGPPTTLRFKVGYGIVDADGKLLKDTVPPGAVKHLRAIRAGSRVVFRWDPVGDPLGLRGYRISAAGLQPLLVQGTSAVAYFSAVRGKKVVVTAVDKAGNVGVAGTVRVSR